MHWHPISEIVKIYNDYEMDNYKQPKKPNKKLKIDNVDKPNYDKTGRNN